MTAADGTGERAVNDELMERLAQVERAQKRHAANDAIRTLLYDYARGCDLNDPALVASLWVDDGILSVKAGDEHGRVAIEKWYQVRLNESTKHHATNVMIGEPTIETDGSQLFDTRAELIAFHYPPSAPVITAGSYVDRIRVTWRNAVPNASFVRRQIIVDGRFGLQELT